MELELSGKTALITGGSKGIGKAVAEGLAAEGCALHLAARTEATLAAARDEIAGRYNVPVAIHPCDVSDGAAVPGLLAAAGTPDILVNNAGAIPAGDLQKIDEATWRTAWDLKVFGYINLTRACYAAMKAGGGGVIVNVTGLAADRTDAGYIAGTTGNAGLNAFTRALGSTSLADGIRVLAVSPGAVATERMVNLMRAKAENDWGDPERWQDCLSGLPRGRAATPREVADMVVFLASPRASYMSGTVVTVDGGHGAKAGSFS